MTLLFYMKGSEKPIVKLNGTADTISDEQLIKLKDASRITGYAPEGNLQLETAVKTEMVGWADDLVWTNRSEPVVGNANNERSERYSQPQVKYIIHKDKEDALTTVERSSIARGRYKALMEAQHNSN